MRTAGNVKSGGRGRLSGVIHGLLLLAILVAFGAYASRIPMGVLTGILIAVGIGIIDYLGLRRMALTFTGLRRAEPNHLCKCHSAQTQPIRELEGA